MSQYYFNRQRVYSKSWNYPGKYDGDSQHPPIEKFEVCYDETIPNNYAYLDSYKGYPFDVTEIDRVIDLSNNSSSPSYDLMN